MSRHKFRYYLKTKYNDGDPEEYMVYEYTLPQIWSGNYTHSQLTVIACCEYTGEFDKNNKEYCEGDLVKMENCFSEINKGSVTVYGEVKYLSGGFYFWNKYGWCEPIGHKPMSAEIIGNRNDKRGQDVYN